MKRLKVLIHCLFFLLLLQNYKDTKKPLYISAIYCFPDVFTVDQLAIIQDLLDRRTGMDTVAIEIFRAAKRRLLNSSILSSIKECNEYTNLPAEIKNSCSSFQSLAVNDFVCMLVREQQMYKST